MFPVKLDDEAPIDTAAVWTERAGEHPGVHVIVCKGLHLYFPRRFDESRARKVLKEYGMI